MTALAEAHKYADAIRTDPAGWRLKVSEDSHGQHKWFFLPPGPARDAWPQTAVDKYSMGEPTVSLAQLCAVLFLGVGADGQGLPDQPDATTPMEAARKGLRFYRELQSEDGHWATEYGGAYEEARTRRADAHRTIVPHPGAHHCAPGLRRRAVPAQKGRAEAVPLEQVAARRRVGTVS